METLRYKSQRFGQIEYSLDDLITFPEGIVGFPDAHRFVLLNHRADSPFRWLQSLDESGLAFLVCDPAAFLNGYEPEMHDDAAAILELTEDVPRLCYVIASIPPGKPRDMTLNLAGPIVINAENHLALQLVVDDPGYAIKHRVFVNQPATSEMAA